MKISKVGQQTLKNLTTKYSVYGVTYERLTNGLEELSKEFPDNSERKNIILLRMGLADALKEDEYFTDEEMAIFFDVPTEFITQARIEHYEEAMQSGALAEVNYI
jgi:hypothetical protein